jgi:hypothetical protein
MNKYVSTAFKNRNKTPLSLKQRALLWIDSVESSIPALAAKEGRLEKIRADEVREGDRILFKAAFWVVISASTSARAPESVYLFLQEKRTGKFVQEGWFRASVVLREIPAAEDEEV